jgi:hypothetical protein
MDIANAPSGIEKYKATRRGFPNHMPKKKRSAIPALIIKRSTENAESGVEKKCCIVCGMPVLAMGNSIIIIHTGCSPLEKKV